MAKPPKGRVKVIIMDKAPNGDQLNMQNELGFQGADYVALANAFNQEFGTQVTAADIDNLPTVQDVVNYMESL